MRTPAKSAAESLSHRGRGDGPGYEYGRHSRDHHEPLSCIYGSIVFHANKQEIPLEPGTVRAAAVGPDGVERTKAPGQRTAKNRNAGPIIPEERVANGRALRRGTRWPGARVGLSLLPNLPVA